MNSRSAQVLVLDAAYEPVNLCSLQRALKLMYKGLVRVEESMEDNVIYRKTLWDEDTGDFVVVPIYQPVVIRLIHYKYIAHRSHILSRKNIFIRDNYTCVYCHTRGVHNTLTLDHVHPRSLGGKSTWENLVTCCHACNNRKGDKLLSELPDMKLDKPPKTSTSQSARYLMRKMAYDNPLWQKYLFF